MPKPLIRTPYNYNTDEASMASALSCPEPTLTQQHYKDEVDINTIVKNFGLTGELPQNIRMPVYGDFSQVVDYHTAHNAMRHAEEAFMALPAKVRERFQHNPQKFVEFCSDDANAAEARALGLVDGPPPDLNSPPPSTPPNPV